MEGIINFYMMIIFSVIQGAYELKEIAELKKEKTEGNVIIEPDMNTMKNLTEKNRVH